MQLLDQLMLFIGDLRDAGIAVSTSEVLDATNAVRHVDPLDKSAWHAALQITLIKSAQHLATFDQLFLSRFDDNTASVRNVSEAGLIASDDESAPPTGDEVALREVAYQAARRAGEQRSGMAAGHFLGMSDQGINGAHVVTVRAHARIVAPEQVEFLRATAEELRDLHRLTAVLGTKLAARLRQRNRRGHSGKLRPSPTMRKALAAGGVPFDPVFRRPRRQRPDVVVLADVSGSVATFAKFTLQLVHALSGQFGRWRTFVFVDEIDEITEFLRTSRSIDDIIADIEDHALTTGDIGHSDYGIALERFWGRWGGQIHPTTTVLVLGDARNNYHPVRAEVLDRIKQRCRRIYWLNPEPRAHWDSGDSVIGSYGVYCDEVFECRTLAQLADAIERIS